MNAKNKRLDQEEAAAAADPIFTDDNPEPEPGALAVPSATSPIIHTTPGAALHAGGKASSEIKLAQPTSAVGEPGSFYAKRTGENLGEEVRAVVVKLQPTRALFSTEFQRGVGPECASADGVYAVTSFYGSEGDEPLYPGRECSTCPYYSEDGWTPGPGGRTCKPGYDAYFISLSTFEIILYRLSGTATYAANTLARPDVFGKKVVKLFSKRQVSQQGSWFQLFCQPMEPITAEQAVVVNQVIHKLSPELESEAA
jgi:hypothetical protein